MCIFEQCYKRSKRSFCAKHWALLTEQQKTELLTKLDEYKRARAIMNNKQWGYDSACLEIARSIQGWKPVPERSS